jgi:hypothetical protein
MLWAGVLFVWELIGIDLEKAKAAGGNFGGAVSAIKSPQAVPWVLLILVGYFIFKVTVEWYQCDENRRRVRVAKIDYISALVVSLIAYALYVVQVVSRIQFADFVSLDSNRLASCLVGVLSGAVGLLVWTVKSSGIESAKDLLPPIGGIAAA